MKQLYIVYNFINDDDIMELSIQELEYNQYQDYFCERQEWCKTEYFGINTQEQFQKTLEKLENYYIEYSLEHLHNMPFNHFKNNLLWLIHNNELKLKVISKRYHEINDLLNRNFEELPLEKNEKDFQQYIYNYCQKHNIKINNQYFNLLDFNNNNNNQKLINEYKEQIKYLQQQIKKLED